MSLVIPTGFTNWIITVHNSNGGASADSHLAIATENTGTIDQTSFARVANLHRDGLKVLWDNGWTVGPVKAYVNNGGVLELFEDSTTETCTATAADYASPAVQVIMGKFTGLAGRQYRGRLYLPGVIETKVDEGGTLDSTYKSDLQTAVDSWLTSVVADAAVDAIVLLHDSSSPGLHTPTTCTAFPIRPTVGTMRPRQRR